MRPELLAQRGVWLQLTSQMHWYSWARAFSRLLLLWLCLSGALISVADAESTDQASQAETELKEIRARIQTIKSTLSGDREKRDSISVELEQIERQVATAAKKLNDLAEELEIKQVSLTAARADQQQTRTELLAEREALIEQVRGAYIIGAQENLKLLLNQDDPAIVGRMLVYYDYLNKARSMRMQMVKNQLDHLAKLEKNIAIEAAALKDLETRQRATVERLEASRVERNKVVDTLTAVIQQKGNDLERAAKAEQALTKLLKSLARDLRDIPPDIGGRRPFAKQKGRLRWPVSGRVTNRYGAWREPGKIRWRGVQIAAKPGAAVRAISYGRVVFADWMPRFGMLIIVEHDAGYMSLYAHNETIFKKVGDKVEPGQVIAAVGNSGGRREAGLYFEVRRKANTINPAIWCKRPAAS